MFDFTNNQVQAPQGGLLGIHPATLIGLSLLSDDGGGTGSLAKLLPALMNGRTDPAKQFQQQLDMARYQLDTDKFAFEKQKLAGQGEQQAKDYQTKELAQADAAAIKDSRTAAGQAMQVLDAANNFEGVLKDTSDAVVGPLVSTWGINRALSTNVQKLEQEGNKTALLARSLLGMSAANMSDADREFLVKLSLNTNSDKEALQENITRLKGLASSIIDKNRFYEKRFQDKGNLLGATSDYYDAQHQTQAAPGKQQAEAAAQGQSQQSSSQQLPQYNDDQWNAWAQDAIAKGADPTAVQQEIKRLRGMA